MSGLEFRLPGVPQGCPAMYWNLLLGLLWLVSTLWWRKPIPQHSSSTSKTIQQPLHGYVPWTFLFGAQGGQQHSSRPAKGSYFVGGTFWVEQLRPREWRVGCNDRQKQLYQPYAALQKTQPTEGRASPKAQLHSPLVVFANPFIAKSLYVILS